VRLTDFWTRLEESFGGAYARSLAADQSIAGLGGRTIDEALAQGEETATVWRAVVAAYPDRVPSRLR
jgi:tRNA A22 N-methylase